MPLYLVSYDVPVKNADDYQSLWDYLDDLGSVKILLSQYATPFDEGALDLVKQINTHLKKGDRVLVCEIFNSPTVAWSNLKISSDDFKAMLKKYARGLNG